MGDFEKRQYLVQAVVSEKGVTYHAKPYGSPYQGTEVWAFSPEEAVAIAARGAASPHPVEVRSPREALLAIRAECRGVHCDTDPFETATVVDRLAEDGLRPRRLDTFEYTDQLTERLAKALKLLREIYEEDTDVAVVSGEISEALALPPDIEAAVELRG